jgi:hypothetical protein
MELAKDCFVVLFCLSYFKLCPTRREKHKVRKGTTISKSNELFHLFRHFFSLNLSRKMMEFVLGGKIF